MIKPISHTAVDLLQDDRWVIDFLVCDDNGKIVDATPVVTVTSPDDVVTTPAATRLSLGKYRVAVELIGMPVGLYVAVIKATGRGVAVFNALTSAVTTAAQMVYVEDCKDYADDALNNWDDDQIATALNSESLQQRKRCVWTGAYPDDLREALLRRVKVSLAWRSRNFSSEILGDAEIAVNLPGNDPVVRRLEAPYRKVRLGL